MTPQGEGASVSAYTPPPPRTPPYRAGDYLQKKFLEIINIPLKHLFSKTLITQKKIFYKNQKIMNKRIYKYVLNETDNQTIDLPIGAEILTVRRQRDTPCLWALVDPTQLKEKRYIEMYNTGANIHYDMGISRKYLGTFISEGETIVYHIFENTSV